MSLIETTELFKSEIVIVDDAPDNLKLLSDMLESVGYSVVKAISGKEAMLRIEEKLPSLILLDVMMPQMDGFEVCRKLKENERTSDIPVVFISALDDEKSKLTGFQAGGVDYISKPFRKEEVLARVKTQLSLYLLQLDLIARNNKLENEIVRRKHAELALEKRMIAMTQPLEDAMIIDFEDLFNIKEIQKLQDQFADAFGVASVITHTDGTPITKPSNFSRLCQNIIRCTEKGLKNCMHSDAVIGRHNQGGPIVMTCLSGGLWDAGASISVGGKHVANWLIGQVRNEVQDELKMREYAVEIGAEPDDFIRAFYEVTPMSHEQFQKISEMLFTMAGQLSDMAYQNAQQSRFIKGRKLAEEALLVSEERFRTTFYSIGDGVITTDIEGKVSLMNPVAEQLTGMSQGEATGKPLEEVFCILNEETRETVEIPVRKVLRDGLIVGLANHTILIAKDGTEYPISDSGAPIRNEKGEIVGVVLVFRDKTEEKDAENALVESEERYNAFINADTDMVFVKDDQFRYLMANDSMAKFFGKPKEQLINKTDQELADEKTLYPCQSSDRKALETETILTIEEHIGDRIYETTKFPLQLRGHKKGIGGIMRDITERKIAVEALIEAEEKMQAFFNQSLDGFFFMMLDEPIDWNNLSDKEQLIEYAFSHQKITRINDAMLDQYGAVRIQFVGLTPKEMFAHDIAHGKNVWRKLFDNGKLHVETDERKLNGDQIIIEGDYTCLYDSKGRITGHFGIQRDITQNKIAIEAIINERKILRTLIDNLPDAIYVKDKDCRKIVANQFDIDNIGLSNEAEALGKTDLELFNSEIGKRGYEDDLKVIRKGESVINREEVFFDKNGVQRWLLTSKIPLFDQRGKVSGLVGIGRDISEQKKANETIHKLSKSIEQSPSTIVITDINGEIEYVNPKFTEITGYTPAEVIGKNPRILKSGLMTVETYENLWETISRGDVWRGEFQNRKKNGELYWEWATITSIKNENGEITNYISIKEDISVRKQLEIDLIVAKEKAEENDRLKSAFLANMSHEIRTPLNSIIGFSELLSDPDFESNQRYEFARIITNSGNNLLAIISDIMDISKIEAGQVEVKKSVFSAQKLLQEVHHEYKYSAHDKTINLVVDPEIPMEEFLIYSDKPKLKQVLINFVGNALKFTDKGTIEIGMKIGSNIIKFYVKDSGIGVPYEHHARIFERFRQVEGSSTRKYGGNGLGLAISKSLIEMLNGKIGMDSEPGKGSTFFFSIPLDIG